MSISEINGLSVENSEVVINVDRPDFAAQILAQNGWQNIRTAQGAISAAVNHEQVPQIISLLAGNGVLVYGVSQQSSNSLESFYMQLTGGSKIE